MMTPENQSPRPAETPEISALPDTPSTEEQGAETTGKATVAKIGLVILAFSILGAGAGFGITSLMKDGGAGDKQPTYTTVAPEQGGALTDEDPMRNWNLNSAARISPLISQLARADRATFGMQLSLCEEQQATLVGVLELPAPPNAGVAEAFDSWRNSVDGALKACLSTKPSGDDKRDIRMVSDRIAATEKKFAVFIKALKPHVDASYQPRPDAFEPAQPSPQR